MREHVIALTMILAVLIFASLYAFMGVLEILERRRAARWYAMKQQAEDRKNGTGAYAPITIPEENRTW